MLATGDALLDAALGAGAGDELFGWLSEAAAASGVSGVHEAALPPPRAAKAKRKARLSGPAGRCLDAEHADGFDRCGVRSRARAHGNG